MRLFPLHKSVPYNSRTKLYSYSTNDLRPSSWYTLLVIFLPYLHSCQLQRRPVGRSQRDVFSGVNLYSPRSWYRIPNQTPAPHQPRIAQLSVETETKAEPHLYADWVCTNDKLYVSSMSASVCWITWSWVKCACVCVCLWVCICACSGAAYKAM